MFVDFTAEPFAWQGDKQAWVFVRLPTELAADIAELAADAARRTGARRGYGTVRIAARIGDTEWRTSLFPEAEPRGYLLPLKRAVREAEAIEPGRAVTVYVRLLDL